MKFLILLIFFFSFPLFSFSQDNLPINKMKVHLKECAEISDTTENIFVKKMCGNDSISVYSFCSNSVHKYWFLLLKTNYNFRILNCDNFNDEWEYIDVIFASLKKEINYSSISQILWQYKLNSNYHPTPPFPNLKKLKNERGEVLKSIYPPRKLHNTTPFYFEIN